MYKLGEYFPGESPVHSRDPRVKIVGVIALSIIILQVNFIGLLVVSGMVITISQLARIPIKFLLKNLRPVLIFFFCLFLMYIFFTPGRSLPGFPIGPVLISYEGLYLGVVQVLKFMLLVIGASILTMTTPQSEITIGLERLLRPIRITGISSHDIAMMVSLALRFIPTLLDEMNCISEAQLARGANFNPSRISGRIKAITHLAAPLSLSIFRRCDELVDAMEARGYHQGSRTYLRDLVLTPMDICLITSFIVLVITVLLWHP
jgi:biotin transport system permease protein/energy-coupling factor transport system permease protein